MPKFSLVILTFNRPDMIKKQFDKLQDLHCDHLEIIVVDNCSEQRVDDIAASDPRASVIRNPENLGAVGRNTGMIQAHGEYIITLDDDVYGLTNQDLDSIEKIFISDSRIAAINFSVREENTEVVTDWCHPRDIRQFSNTEFKTNDISEGAVVFRKKALEEVGYYPEYFFISHEGPDLAFRLINAKWIVIYTPTIRVTHAYMQTARVSWRRYYYDTRNQLWLALRNYTLVYGVVQVSLAWASVFAYALRDGYMKYWFKGVIDAINGAGRAWADRVAPSKEAIEARIEIEQFRPSFLSRLRRRLFTRVVRG